ncbi:MAG TPA: glycosyltransferase family 39 protein [Bryobacteraceae bacterium]|nr:glycosyltransferase family 39 protein [Bryobacteraceae bacterium]
MTGSIKTESAREPLALRAAGWRIVGLPQWRRLLWGGVLLAVLLVSRVPLAPRYLITFDEINFALSIDHFAPGAHQPQPPGYPLFVGLLKLLAFAIPSVETVFLAAALLLSMASLVLLWMVGARMWGRSGGLIAALLLLCNPPFWFSALTNPVRLALSSGAAGTALCLLVALRRRSGRWCVVATAVLGVAGGFRPTLLVEMAPLLLWTVVSLRLSWKTILAAAGAGTLAVMTWLPPLISASGGLESFYQMLRSYTVAQTHATSLLTGALLPAALHMAAEAIIWSCLGVLTWVWALPSALRRRPHLVRETLGSPFLMLWFLPSLAMSAIFHVGDPDQTLTIIPVTCLVGACVLSAFGGGSSVRSRSMLIGLALFLNVFLFFKPISKIAKASTYKVVTLQDGYIRGLVDGARAIQDPGGVTVIFPPDTSGWRNVSYYVPGARLVVADPQTGGVVNGRSDVVRVPACGVIAVADERAVGADASGVSVPASQSGRLLVFRARARAVVHSRGISFVADEPCRVRAAPAP